METVEGGRRGFLVGFWCGKKGLRGERVASCRRRGGRGASRPVHSPCRCACSSLSFRAVQGLLLLFPLPVQCGPCGRCARWSGSVEPWMTHAEFDLVGRCDDARGICGEASAAVVPMHVDLGWDGPWPDGACVDPETGASSFSFPWTRQETGLRTD